MSDSPSLEHEVNVLRTERAVLFLLINQLVEMASHMHAHGGQLPPTKGSDALENVKRTVVELAEVHRRGS